MEKLSCVFNRKIDKNGNAYYVSFSNAPCMIDMSNVVMHLFRVDDSDDSLELIFSAYDKNRQKRNNVSNDRQSWSRKTKREKPYSEYNDVDDDM